MKNALFFLSILFIVGCTSGKRSLEKGKYNKATTEAVKQLKSNPNNKKAASVLVQSYPLAKKTALQKIQTAMNTNNPDKYSIAVEEYRELAALATLINGSPKALQLVGAPDDFSSQLGEFLPKAAEEKYNQGNYLMQTADRKNAREAYYAFLKANDYVRGYKDVNSKINEALDAATLKVVVDKPQIPARFQLSSDFFYDNLMNELTRISKDRFVKFYTWQETGEGRYVKPDQYMVLDFEDFSVGNTREFTDRYEAVKDSVVVGRTQVNGQSVDVYGTVKAKVTLYKQEVMSQGLLAVRIVNQDNTRTLDSKKFPGQFVWGNQWLSFNGDERALSREEKKLANSGPLPPPPPQDMFVEFTKPIFSQVSDYVRRYYSGY